LKHIKKEFVVVFELIIALFDVFLLNGPCGLTEMLINDLAHNVEILKHDECLSDFGDIFGIYLLVAFS
jgi:hypothetical protein